MTPGDPRATRIGAPFRHHLGHRIVETVQTVLRRHGTENPGETLGAARQKDLCRPAPTVRIGLVDQLAIVEDHQPLTTAGFVVGTCGADPVGGGSDGRPRTGGPEQQNR